MESQLDSSIEFDWRNWKWRGPKLTTANEWNNRKKNLLNGWWNKETNQPAIVMATLSWRHQSGAKFLVILGWLAVQ